MNRFSTAVVGLSFLLAPAALAGQESAASPEQRCASGDPMPVGSVPEPGAALPAPAPTGAAPVPIPNLCEVRTGERVVIRGTADRAADPLYVIDGVVLGRAGAGPSPLSTIPPTDIESITVRKDPASIAEYGTEARNGVVLVRRKPARVLLPQP